MQKFSLRKTFLSRPARQFFAVLVLAFLLGPRAVADDSSGDPGSLSASFPYVLVGIARCDGVSYASLIDRQTGDHFLLSTDRKSQLDVALASVQTEDDASGPSAILQKDGVSVLLQEEAGATLISSPVSSSSSPVSPGHSAPAGSAAAAHLKPPPGATLPLVFQEVDPKKMTLTDDQKATLNQLRQDFINAVNGTSPGNTTAPTTTPSATSSNPSSSSPSTSQNTSQNTSSSDQQLQVWLAAQEHSDEMFRMLYGFQAFNAYTESSSYPTMPR